MPLSPGSGIAATPVSDGLRHGRETGCHHKLSPYTGANSWGSTGWLADRAGFSFDKQSTGIDHDAVFADDHCRDPPLIRFFRSRTNFE